MAHIDWALLCDLAFFDKQDRLCIVGVIRQLPTPRLPLAVGHLMLVAQLSDVRPVEDVELSIAMVTPSGAAATPCGPDHVVVDIAHRYVLVTLRDVPLTEEGIYRFQLALNAQSVANVDIPVLTLARSAASVTH